MTAKLVLIHRRKKRLNKLTPKWVRKRTMGVVGELKEGTIQSNKKKRINYHYSQQGWISLT